MAIPHFRAQIISRSAGRSVVASAAYRHRARMHDEREDADFDYRKGKELAHAELAWPADAPQWVRTMLDGRTPAQASETLWNRVEREERHINGQLAREVVIALPIELSKEQNIALMRAFVGDTFVRRGMIADWVYHDKPGNPHVHVMHTLRPLEEKGFGRKKVPVLDEAGAIQRNGKHILYKNWAGHKDELIEWRHLWGEAANHHLAMAGHDVRIDMRSYAEQGLAVTPTVHMGPTGFALKQSAPDASYRAGLNRESRAINAAALEAWPGDVLALVTREKSVFDERDVARVLHRYIDDPAVLSNALAQVMALPDVVSLRPRISHVVCGIPVSRQVYSTREMIRIETGLIEHALKLSARRGYAASAEKACAARSFLAPEQREAVRYLAGDARLAVVVGLAGAGKTTMLAAAHEAWMGAGHRVFGAALAGKAAEGLQEGSGIVGRTLASWELAWSRGRDLLTKGDVFVVDEAGMVSSRQLARIVETVERAGAKLVLVGDAQQLQPIEAGAAFRGIAEAVGFMELQEVRRQREEWARLATQQFARGETSAALAAYHERGCVLFAEDRAAARAEILSRWREGEEARVSQIILAHSNTEVRAFNIAVRELLKQAGQLKDEHTFMTARGARMFAAGDRVLFLKNDRDLGVMNGMVGVVRAAAANRLSIELMGGRVVDVEAGRYANLDHGYAATVHKAQGVTVDRAYVLATQGMDQHLTYVAMSRHRESAVLVAAQSDYADFAQLSRRLSRYGGKELATDYLPVLQARRTARAFAERRGIDTLRSFIPALREAIAAKLAVLCGRLEHVPPPLLPAITRFGTSIEAHARSTAFADKALQKHTRELEQAAARLYRDPKVAVAKIEDAIAQGRAGVADEVTRRPGAYGALHGSERLLGGLQPRRERREALASVPMVAGAVRMVEAIYKNVYGAAAERERANRAAMAVEVPALSQAAHEALRQLDAVRKQGAEHHAAAVKSLETAQPKIMAEIARFMDAARQRFGRVDFTSPRTDLAARVPPQDRTRLEEIRRVLQAAQLVEKRLSIPPMQRDINRSR